MAWWSSYTTTADAAEVIPYVRQAFSRLEWKAGTGDVREYAEAISQGKRIVFNTKRSHL